MSESYQPQRSGLLSQRPDLVPLLDHAAHAMLAVTPQGHIMHANARAEALLDTPAALLAGRTLFDVLPERTRAILQRRLDACAHGEAPDDLEVMLGSGDSGALASVTFLPHPPVVLLLLRDLTGERFARDAAREQAREYERARADDRKMIDLGTLIAGVTHDMRTPLTYAANHLAIARRRIEALRASDPALAARLDVVLADQQSALEGLERVRRLLIELRPLTKNKPHRTALVDLADLVRESVRIFEATRSGTTRVALELQSTHRVPVDREDMLNVLGNLLTNAAQAMGGGGTIHVSTRNNEMPPEIRVRDEGPGIAPEVRSRLFQPFLTTKPEGTGLGLFISRRTVEAHGGTLRCESDANGATFIIQLPAIPEGTSAAGDAAQSSR